MVESRVTVFVSNIRYPPISSEVIDYYFERLTRLMWNLKKDFVTLCFGIYYSSLLVAFIRVNVMVRCRISGHVR